MQLSLLILLASFSVGLSSYVITAGEVDHLTDALYMLIIFMLCVLIIRIRGLPYTLR